MKQVCSLLLALVMALTLLSGCGSNVKADADMNVEAALVSREDHYPALPGEVRDMDTESLVADYLSGAWDGSMARSSDNLVTVNLCVDGSLSYCCYSTDHSRGADFSNSEALPMVRRVVAGESLSSLPEDWRGEKIYVDLPGQKLPENALGSGRISGVGTHVQTTEGITLYLKESIVDTWAIPANEVGLLSTQNPKGFGGNYARADSKFFQLFEGGETELLYDNVIDADTGVMPDLTVLTLENGVLIRHEGAERPDNQTEWTDKLIGEDVAEARIMLFRVVYRTNDGEAFLFLDADSEAISLGKRTLDEIKELWNEYCRSAPAANLSYLLNGFLEEYGELELNASIAE